MRYWLGVDLGTTYTAAAVWIDGRIEVVDLGARRSEIASIAYVEADGGILVGDAAARRGTAEPQRLAREFKRRVGDPIPLLIGGAPVPPHVLMARLLEFVVTSVTAQRGSEPAGVAVTYPANWGPYKRELLDQAVRQAGIDDPILVTEPEAIAIAFASDERVTDGEVIAVYDLGGGTFDAAVLARSADGFTVLGRPDGIEHLGGIDFDEAVFSYVTGSLDLGPDQLDPADDQLIASIARLRGDCTAAKEALSYDTEVTIPVALPGLHTAVRLNRSEFESMITPALTATVAALNNALRSAGISAADLRNIVLAGGSSRIPLVAQLVSQQIRRPVLADARPEHSVAAGAARIAAGRATDVRPGSAAPAAVLPPLPDAASGGNGHGEGRPTARRGPRVLLIAVIVGVLVLGGAGAAWLITGAGGNGGNAGPAGAPTSSPLTTEPSAAPGSTVLRASAASSSLSWAESMALTSGGGSDDRTAAGLAARLGKPEQLLVGVGSLQDFGETFDHQLTLDIYDEFLPIVNEKSWVDYGDGGGTVVDDVALIAAGNDVVPMFTVYQFAAGEVGGIGRATNPDFMWQYWSSMRLLFEKLGRFGRPALVNVEPVFWGHAQNQAQNNDPTSVPVEVSIAPGCSGLDDNLTGYVSCVLRQARDLAPATAVGFAPARWGNADPDQVVAFMAAAGASAADFVAVETSATDAGCVEVGQLAQCQGDPATAYWDDADFADHLAWAGTLHAGLDLPLLWWQTPMGVPSDTPGGTPGHYRDNREQYFLTRPAELVAAGGFGVVFSSGSSEQTSLWTDGGQFKSLSDAYFAHPEPLK